MSLTDMFGVLVIGSLFPRVGRVWPPQKVLLPDEGEGGGEALALVPRVRDEFDVQTLTGRIDGLGVERIAIPRDDRARGVHPVSHDDRVRAACAAVTTAV